MIDRLGIRSSRSVSIFETDPQTEESNRLAAEFVQHSEMISLLRRVEMITGEVVAHCSDKLATG